MRANPGGEIPPQDVIGRAELGVAGIGHKAGGLSALDVKIPERDRNWLSQIEPTQNVGWSKE